ncbi:MAG: hypothetical protein WCX69_05535 [Candidatus Paceibacterota bacterium]
MSNLRIFLASDSFNGTHLRPARTLLPDIFERRWQAPVARCMILPFFVILNLFVIDFLVFILLVCDFRFQDFV